MKDREYVTMLDEYESIGPHWIVLYVNAENVTYFVCFGVEQIPKKKKQQQKIIRNKSIITNIHRIQVYDSVMCGYV